MSVLNTMVATNPAPSLGGMVNTTMNAPMGSSTVPSFQPIQFTPSTLAGMYQQKAWESSPLNINNVLKGSGSQSNFYIPGVTTTLPSGSSQGLQLSPDAFSGVASNISSSLGNTITSATGNSAIGNAVSKTLGAGLGNVGKTASHIISSKGVKALGDAGAKKALGASFKTGVTDMFKSGAGWGMAADIASSFLPQKTEYAGDKGGITQGLDSVYDGISDAISFIPGFGTAAGAIMKGAKFLGKGINALGGGTDGMTTADAILGSSFLNITPLGMINGFGGKRAITIKKDNEAFEEVGGSYTGTNAMVDDAVSKSGKKYGLVSGSARRKANRLIQEAKFQQAKVGDIADVAKNNREAAAYMADFSNASYINKLNGGYDQKAIRVGKTGMKLISNEQKKRAKSTLNKIKKINEEVRMEEVAQFAEGGKMNVIPEGALHARLHHMDVEGITKKGIPVVIEEAGGELVQQAEIERNEIIFTKEVTDKLEELYKKGTDEAAIEAGKLLVHEIIENTIDNTGLIDEVV